MKVPDEAPGGEVWEFTALVYLAEEQVDCLTSSLPSMQGKGDKSGQGQFSPLNRFLCFSKYAILLIE